MYFYWYQALIQGQTGFSKKNSPLPCSLAMFVPLILRLLCRGVVRRVCVRE